MRERVFKATKFESIEQIEADIVDALAARVGDEELMVFEVFNAESLPLIQEAIISCKPLFFDVGCLPVIRFKPAMDDSTLFFDLVALALSEALDMAGVGASREQWKKTVFEKAALVIRTSSPELVKDIITNEFNDQMLESLAKF